MRPVKRSKKITDIKKVLDASSNDEKEPPRTEIADKSETIVTVPAAPSLTVVELKPVDDV